MLLCSVGIRDPEVDTRMYSDDAEYSHRRFCLSEAVVSVLMRILFECLYYNRVTGNILITRTVFVKSIYVRQVRVFHRTVHLKLN